VQKWGTGNAAERRQHSISPGKALWCKRLSRKSDRKLPHSKLLAMES
jgi:hypothetical protein